MVIFLVVAFVICVELIRCLVRCSVSAIQTNPDLKKIKSKIHYLIPQFFSVFSILSFSLPYFTFVSQVNSHQFSNDQPKALGSFAMDFVI